MTPVAPGDVLAGKYRVTKVLGIGGMGVVVAATHIQLDQNVALKFMLPEALGSAEAVARFLREARAAVQLHSEHVARVSDVGTLETGAPYIVMEYLEGTDLAGVLASRGTLRPEEAVEYILQASDALAEAHSLGIVHRDLKPANLFLTKRRDGTPLVKVLDFGISKASALNEQGAGGLTKTGGIMGSPLYMSPEQMKSAKDADARADIWALGIILYELLGGRPPFDSDTLGALMARVLTEPPPPLASVRPDLPPALCDAIARCLEKDRNRRWPTIAHLATALVPFAPPRARPLVERISIVLGQTAQWIAADVPPPAMVAGPPAVADAHGGTIRGWSETAGGSVVVGQCSAVCTPTTTRCDTGGLQTCGSNGQWGATTTCTGASSFCAASACSTEPPSCQGGGAGAGANCGGTAGTVDCCASLELPATSGTTGSNCIGVLADLAPVGFYASEDGRWGHADLAGNVWEWTLDWYVTPYSTVTCADCADTTMPVAHPSRVLRGGSYDYPTTEIVNSYRYPTDPLNLAGDSFGFRCARVP
jgi:serine/threonine-protein kinase